MKKNIYYYTITGLFLLLGAIVSAQPTISGLSLDATTSGFSTNDDLTVSYTATNTVETAISWYVDWVPLTVFNYPFEAETTNALRDFSGNGNDLSTSGIASTEPTWSATGGHNGTGAFTFDGNDYLLAGEVLPLNSDYTKCAWVTTTTLAGYKNIISGDLNDENNHGFKVNPDGTLNAGHSFGAFYVSDPVPLVVDTWYFVAVTFDYESGLMILYKDGVEVDRAIVPESNRSVIDATVLIGSKVYAFFWNGEIDDAMLFDRELSPEQIQSIYTTRGEDIFAQETHGGDNWRVRVTGFSATEVGNNPITGSELIQAPDISGLTLSAETPASLTDEDLTASFSSNASVTETATAWYRDGNPDALMYLPFEGGTADALLDVSGSDNHASMVNDILYDPIWDATGGHDGTGGFEFDGDDYLEAGDIFPLASSYTKTAWVYSTVWGFNNIISSVLHDDNNHFLKINDDGRLNAGHSFGTAIVADGTPLALDTWYFVAVTFDYATGEMILYKNGSDVSTATVSAPLRDVADASVLIGSMNTILAWDGNIDEPRIYDRVLSPEQISAMYGGNNVMVAEETFGGEDWDVEVIPFARYESNSSTGSNTVTVHSVVVSDIADQNTTEGSTFTTLDLDDYVTVYEFSEAELDWTSTGSSELVVVIDPVSHVATITIPGTDWFGAEDITFIATNPNDDSDETEVRFTVSNVNDEPVLAVLGGQITNEDVPLTGLSVDFTDADPIDSHIITVLSSNPNVVPSAPTGNTTGSTYDLVPAANWNGSTQITVTVTDDGIGTLFDSEIYTLLVNAVNDAPVLTDVGNQSINEDNSLTGLSVVFTDADTPDLHTITVVSDDVNVSVQNLTGNINGSMYDLVPVGDWNGSAEITVTVTDNGSGALSDSETYTFTVNAVNDDPVLTDIGAQSTSEDVNLTGLSVVFSDPDASDSHTITVVSSDANVTMANLSGNISGSTYDLALAANWNGTAQITVRVTDNGTGALSDFETYTLTVNAVNDAPVISEVGDQILDEDNALRGVAVIYSDPEAADTHTISVVSAEANVIVANLNGDASGSTYTLVPAANWTGAAQITVTVTEVSGGLSDTEIYTLNVNPINDAPDTVRLSNAMVDERVALETVVGLFSSYDVDMTDTHTYTFVLDGGVNDVDNDAFIIVGDTLKTNVNLDYEGQSSYSILVQSDDGQGGTSSQNFIIEVNDVNETGVEDIYNNPSFNVYPVPAIDNITVEVDNPDNKELLLEIYSNTGRLVHAEPIYSKSRIDLTGFTDGMYILRIKGEQVYGTRKILVKDR